MKTIPTSKPATFRQGRRFLQLTAALVTAVSLLGATASAGPNEQWTNNLGIGTGGSITPAERVLTIDSAGNSYIVGTGDFIPPFNSAPFVTKVDVDGVFQWVTVFNSTGAFTDAVIDNAGDLVVTGWVNELSRTDLITAKLDTATGNVSPTWPDAGFGVGVRRVSSPSASHKGWRCVIGGGGDVIVAGASETRFIMARYTPAGDPSPAWPPFIEEQGIRVFVPPGGSVSTNSPTLLKQDSSGNLLLAGTSFSVATGTDIVIAKFNDFGVFQWSSGYVRNSSGHDVANDLAVGPTGHAYVTGLSEDVANNRYEMAVVRFNQGNGSMGWVNRSTGAASGQSVKVNASDVVFVAGSHGSTNTMSIWKYNAAGNLATSSWPAAGGNPAGVRRLGGVVGDGGDDLALTAAGELYFTGRTWDAGVQKLTTWKLDAVNGTTDWIERATVASNNSRGDAIKVGPGGHVIATGRSRTASAEDLLFVVRYIP
jgi:hypothetical protein